MQLHKIRSLKRTYSAILFGFIALSPVVLAVTPESHLGGCILRQPVNEGPADPYLVSDAIPTGEYPPFVKKLSVYGLTLVGGEETSDDFMRLVGRTIVEMFPRGPEMDADRQADVLANHRMYGAVIPVPLGEDFSFMQTSADDWAKLQTESSVCDIIMQDVPGQVMEVVEHILHYVSDIGLHYAYPDQWGIAPDSVLVQGMRDAVERGYYDISQYSDIDDLEVRNRVLVQEFAYWVISTAWNLQEDYGPRGEAEWQIADRTISRPNCRRLTHLSNKRLTGLWLHQAAKHWSKLAQPGARNPIENPPHSPLSM